MGRGSTLQTPKHLPPTLPPLLHIAEDSGYGHTGQFDPDSVFFAPEPLLDRTAKSRSHICEMGFIQAVLEMTLNLLHSDLDYLKGRLFLACP